MPIAVAPFLWGGMGMIYFISALLLSAGFIALAIPVGLRSSEPGDTMKPEKRLFGFSIIYLFALFAALVVDRVAAAQGWL
jgi:protoheme IX farnesyltransferase